MARIVDIACFQHDMTYGDFKDLPKRTASDKVLRDKALNIGKNMMDIKEIFCSDSTLCMQTNLLQVVLVKLKLGQTKNYQNNHKN